MNFKIACFAFALLAASVSHAASDPRQDMTAAEFTLQKALFVQQLDDGKTYSEISPDDRKQVVSMLDRMDARMKAAGSIDRMSQEDRIAFFNDQEAVNTLLTKAKEDSRVICSRETPTGTHRFVTHCESVAQRRTERENAQRELEKVQREGIPPIGGG